jgi:cytochrome c556
MERVNRMFVGCTLLAGVAVTGPVATAAQGPSRVAAAAQDASPVVEYRQSLMQSFRMHMRGVRASLGDTAPLGHAELHAVAFRSMAQALADAFPANRAGAGSRALPAIWENRDDFMDKVTAIQNATARLVSASRSGDGDAIGSALQAVQSACRGCHTTYRGPENE